MKISAIAIAIAIACLTGCVTKITAKTVMITTTSNASLTAHATPLP